jgi:hypothetical protein
MIRRFAAAARFKFENPGFAQSMRLDRAVALTLGCVSEQSCQCRTRRRGIRGAVGFSAIIRGSKAPRRAEGSNRAEKFGMRPRKCTRAYLIAAACRTNRGGKKDGEAETNDIGSAMTSANHDITLKSLTT